MDLLALDTNTILRFLANDIPSQAKITEKKLEDAKSGKINIYVYQITVVEIIYHLVNWYKKNKEEACETLIALFSPDWIQVENKIAVFQSLRAFKDKNIDFVDLLLFFNAESAGRSVFSFDKHFENLRS